MLCPHCGQPVAEAATFCGSCGKPLVEGVHREREGYHAGHELAGFWPRLGAYLIDAILIALVAASMALLGILLAVMMVPEEGEGGVTAAVVSGFGFGGAFIVGGGLAWRFSARGTSPGARAAGVRIVDKVGGPPGVARGLRRVLVASFLSGQVLWLGYLWAIWDRDKRTWHDYLAGTWVVRDE